MWICTTFSSFQTFVSGVSGIRGSQNPSGVAGILPYRRCLRQVYMDLSTSVAPKGTFATNICKYNNNKELQFIGSFKLYLIAICAATARFISWFATIFITSRGDLEGSVGRSRRSRIGLANGGFDWTADSFISIVTLGTSRISLRAISGLVQVDRESLAVRFLVVLKPIDYKRRHG